MSFFEQQDKARRYTKKLLVLFALAVVSIVLLLNGALLFALCVSSIACLSIEQYFLSSRFLLVSALVILVIGLTSLIRWHQLKKGGGFKAIAMVGATKVSLDTKQAERKQLINIVEEMSIASGISMPHIFVMDNESAINAFVAGTEPHNTCLCVTQGALDKLSRQELQGVIAHEYSHVFNGDMRLNMYLIGVLAGILVIGQLGEYLLLARGRRSHSSGRSAGRIAIIGLAMLVVGYLGLFFGRLIKAGISRQREFLADASAVQYTRDRSGITGALYKIKTEAKGSLLQTKSAEEISHLCFERSHKIKWFSDMLATHPPLDARITNIDPHFLSRTHRESRHRDNKVRETKAPPSQSVDAKPPTMTASMMLAIGQLSWQSVQSAQRQLGQLSTRLKTIARGDDNRFTSADVLLAFMISQNSLSTREIFKQIANHDEFGSLVALAPLVNELSQLSLKQQFLLCSLALARFSEQEKSDQRPILKRLKFLADVDKEVTPIEYSIYALANRAGAEDKPIDKTINHYREVERDLSYCLAVLVHLSECDKQKQDQRLKQTLLSFGLNDTQTILGSFNANQFHQHLGRLNRLNPLLKRPLIEAMMHCAGLDDDKLSEDQRQRNQVVLRSLGNLLNCPIAEYE